MQRLVPDPLDHTIGDRQPFQSIRTFSISKLLRLALLVVSVVSPGASSAEQSDEGESPAVESKMLDAREGHSLTVSSTASDSASGQSERGLTNSIWLMAFYVLAFLIVLRLALWAWGRWRKTAELSLEIQRMQSQKLESLSTLAGGVAHDFNNLLVGIFGYAELARLQVERGSKLDGYLTRIEESANRAAELSRQMLFYSGRGSFSIHPLALSDLVREVAEEMRPTLEASVNVLLELERHLPPMEGDPIQLKEVVRNLILNAVEALESGAGAVVISTGFMVRNQPSKSSKGKVQKPPGNYVFLTVDDTGRGIDVKEIDKVFDPFYSTKSPGRGLGLAVVQGIVRGHQGLLKVSSTSGRGSTFRVLFPAVDRSKLPQKAETVAPEPNWRGAGTVLVVDDEAAVLDVACSYLRRMGFEVVTTRSGEQALEIFGRLAETVDWVLLDISLPGIDGLETARRLRTSAPDLPIIMSSGYSKEEALRGLASPAEGFIEKPYRFADLERVLRAKLPQFPASSPDDDRSTGKDPQT